MRLPGFLERFAKAHPAIFDFGKDIVFSLAVVAVVGLILYTYSGTWPPIVSVRGDSMFPHMHQGDLVLLQGLDRDTVKTYSASIDTNYSMYSEPGDVIVYRPLGKTDVPPIIHRVMYWVNKSEPMWTNGPAAPDSGYITLGDNNHGVLDQQAYNICPDQPVRPEWIVGIARFNVPYLGYIRSIIP